MRRHIRYEGKPALTIDREVAGLPRRCLGANALGDYQDEAPYLSEKVRRIAAILMMGQALDAN